MADNTKIEWTDATANVVNGCSVLSPGCTNCYAMRLAGTRLRDHPTRVGLTQPSKAGPVWTGEVRFHEPALLQVLRWQRPRKIFWNAHGDLFHDNVPDEWIDRCFAVMALAPQHVHQVLTKRSARMREYMANPDRRTNVLDASSHMPGDWKVHARANWHLENWPMKNVWLGVSVEDQARADERIPDLLATPTAVRFISAEPLLGPIGLGGIPVPDKPMPLWNALTGEQHCGPLVHADTARIDWVIAGGESGPGARPTNPQWFRDLLDQCTTAGVPFLLKQNGEWVSVSEVEGPQSAFHTFPDHRSVRRVGKKRAGRTLDGVLHDGYPA